ncbi:hypothetical protein J6590_008166 [Homalodisca vitripennis]|nr:hypothetical protein J6590_008166 [Homalodisca vitripennis]
MTPFDLAFSRGFCLKGIEWLQDALLSKEPCSCQRLQCKSFQTAKRGEVCRIAGCSVAPSPPGNPSPVRLYLPHFQSETFKQFLVYVYTGKVTETLTDLEPILLYVIGIAIGIHC